MKIQSIHYSPLYKSSNVNKISFTNQSSPVSEKQYSDLRVFLHHIYEYKKGLRDLVLTTEKAGNRNFIEERLQSQAIPYHITKVGDKTINVFFGDEECINVVKTFDTRLNKITPEQDFILGTLLGYNKVRQCDRYLRKKEGLNLIA